MAGTFKHMDRFPDSRTAAAIVVPQFLGVAGPFPSVVDVGGGTGAWAAEFKRHGATKVVCIDDPRIDARDVLVAPGEFMGWDLGQTFPSPISSDLAVCLEFAEHIAEYRAEPLVDFLVACAGTVLFSAAIPGQPSPHHINEQPPEYWRALFAARGYEVFDCLRPLIVGDTRLPYWYRQNMLVFACDEQARVRALRSLPYSQIPRDFELVHSSLLKRYRAPTLPGIREIPAIVGRPFSKRMKGA